MFQKGNKHYRSSIEDHGLAQVHSSPLRDSEPRSSYSGTYSSGSTFLFYPIRRTPTALALPSSRTQSGRFLQHWCYLLLLPNQEAMEASQFKGFATEQVALRSYRDTAKAEDTSTDCRQSGVRCLLSLCHHRKR